MPPLNDDTNREMMKQRIAHSLADILSRANIAPDLAFESLTALRDAMKDMPEVKAMLAPPPAPAPARTWESFTPEQLDVLDVNIARSLGVRLDTEGAAFPLTKGE